MSAAITLKLETLVNSASLRKMPCDKDHILIACFPKSGSTWLSESLAQLPDFIRAHLVPKYGRREHELAFERLIAFHDYNYVAQHHVRFSGATERYIDTFSLKPIILIRDIFDCVPSMKDWLDRGIADDRIVGPMAHVPDDYFRWSDEEKLDFIIEMMIPWYFNFFVGWAGFSGGAWLKYRDLLADPASTIKGISDRFGLGLQGSTIQAALDAASRKNTRKNLGQTGRGERLTKTQKDKIRRFASYYPSQDFSAIGL